MSGRLVFYTPMIRSQSFSELVLLCCDLQKCCSVLLCLLPLRWNRMASEGWNLVFTFPQVKWGEYFSWAGSLKYYSWSEAELRIECSGWITKCLFSTIPAGAGNIFSDLHHEKLVGLLDIKFMKGPSLKFVHMDPSEI